MEKLLELLNEYDKIKGDKEEPIYNWKIAIKTKIYQTYLVSARYGFIKRLVDNNKIDKSKIDTRLVRNVENHYDEDGYWVESSYEDYPYIDTLLMLLSISDTPIEDLISYLKNV